MRPFKLHIFICWKSISEKSETETAHHWTLQEFVHKTENWKKKERNGKLSFSWRWVEWHRSEINVKQWNLDITSSVIMPWGTWLCNKVILLVPILLILLFFSPDISRMIFEFSLCLLHFHYQCYGGDMFIQVVCLSSPPTLAKFSRDLYRVVPSYWREWSRRGTRGSSCRACGNLLQLGTTLHNRL